jgi:hypothetical protein
MNTTWNIAKRLTDTSIDLWMDAIEEAFENKNKSELIEMADDLRIRAESLLNRMHIASRNWKELDKEN